MFPIVTVLQSRCYYYPVYEIRSPCCAGASPLCINTDSAHCVCLCPPDCACPGTVCACEQICAWLSALCAAMDFGVCASRRKCTLSAVDLHLLHPHYSVSFCRSSKLFCALCLHSCLAFSLLCCVSEAYRSPRPSSFHTSRSSSNTIHH